MGPRTLFIDIETAPIEAYVWDLFDQNIALNQIKKDWHLLSWSAKWLGDLPSKVMYADQRNSKDIADDKKILEKLWKLMDEADIIVGQNSKKFDVKKLNARFVAHGMQPPSSYKQIDTLQIAKKIFGFTSNKLAYMSELLNKKYKKLDHKEFPGFEMWSECLKGNFKAWKAMEKYNKYDVLSLEETYTKLIAWDNSINFALYYDNEIQTCTCGSTEFSQNGFHYTPSGKYQRFRCKKCGKEGRHTKNLFSKEKRQSLLRRT